MIETPRRISDTEPRCGKCARPLPLCRCKKGLPEIPGSGFGFYLRTLRRQRGATQRELAAMAGIDFTYLSKIENNRMGPPSEEGVRALASALKVDHYELLRRAGKVPREIQEVLLRISVSGWRQLMERGTLNFREIEVLLNPAAIALHDLVEARGALRTIAEAEAGEGYPVEFREGYMDCGQCEDMQQAARTVLTRLPFVVSEGETCE